MPATATLSSKFQISIPKAVREERRWEAGQRFVFIPKGKGVLLMPVLELEQLVGIASGCRVVPLDAAIALLAAEPHREHKLATADAIVYATARQQGADLLTCDAHFNGLPDTVFFAKPARS